MSSDPKLLQLAAHFPLKPQRHATWKLQGKGGIYTRGGEPATLEMLTRQVGMPRADGMDQVARPIGNLPAILEQAKESLLSLQKAAERLRFHRATAYETSHSGRTHLWTPEPISFEDMAVILHGWARMATTPDATALRALLKTLSALQGLSSYGVLLTIMPPRPSRNTEEARAALEALGLNVLQTHVPWAVALQQAALEGVPVREVKNPRVMEVWAVYEDVWRSRPMFKGSKFSFILKDQEQEEPAEQQESTVQDTEAESSGTAAPQYGRRADPEYRQINANIPAGLKQKFRVKLVMQDQTMQEVPKHLIEGYVSGRFKIMKQPSLLAAFDCYLHYRYNVVNNPPTACRRPQEPAVSTAGFLYLQESA